MIILADHPFSDSVGLPNSASNFAIEGERTVSWKSRKSAG
jgi:hypothetical protein